MSVEGKNVIVTGASSGIGRAIATALAAQRARVHFACRSEEKTRPVIEALRRQTGNEALFFLPLELSDLAAVRRCADLFLARGEPLSVLVNNAGIGFSRAVTAQDFEVTFGVNHLGPFLLTLLLRPALERGAPARVVNVASRAHRRARQLDLDALRTPASSPTGWREYEQSKLCNVLFIRELARRWNPALVHGYAVHPGVVATELMRSLPGPVRAVAGLFMLTPEQGAVSALRCATSPELAQDNGRYYGARGEPLTPGELALDDALAARLWERSEAWVRPFLT